MLYWNYGDVINDYIYDTLAILITSLQKTLNAYGWNYFVISWLYIRYELIIEKYAESRDLLFFFSQLKFQSSQKDIISNHSVNKYLVHIQKYSQKCRRREFHVSLQCTKENHINKVFSNHKCKEDERENCNSLK